MTDERTPRGRSRGWKSALWIATLGVLAITGGAYDAFGQWTTKYGGNNTDFGWRRVRPILSECAQEPENTLREHGYIAVGTTNNDPDSDIYVVRTDNNGASVWEHRYDVSSGSVDEGASIFELTDHTGWIVAGTTVTSAGDKDIVVFKINCAGTVQWGRRLGAVGFDETGTDVIVTTTGDPAVNPATQAGDIVVVGHVFNLNPGPNLQNVNAYMARLTGTGGLIWANTYDKTTQTFDPWEERLFAVTELTPIGMNATGDIMAVGDISRTDGIDDGYVLRVNGNTGAIGAAPQGASSIGGCINVPDPFCAPTGTIPYCDQEQFYSVIELQNPGQTGTFSGNPDVVIAGFTTSVGSPDMYLVKLDGGDPTIPEADRYIGDGPDGCSSTNHGDFAWDLTEVPFEMTGSDVAQWDLAVSGSSNRNTTTIRTNAVLITVDPTTLIPIILRRHGADQGADEIARSVHWVSTAGFRSEGFILCGSVSTFDNGADLLLIKTDNIGSSGDDCDEDINLIDNTPGWTAASESTPNTVKTNINPVNISRTLEDQDTVVCAYFVGKRALDPATPGTQLAAFPDGDPRIVPNVLDRGAGSLRVETGVTDATGRHAISLYTSAGELLVTFEVDLVDGAAAVSLPPIESGQYVLSVDLGSSVSYGWITVR